MGNGVYSISKRSLRSKKMNYTSAVSMDEIFTQNRERRAASAMDPKGVTLRESRDSEEHPESLAIVIALDVTGSMGDIPHTMVRDGLPKIMSGIIQKGVEHPQLLFMGVGDHEYDEYPLQVAQFESSDELLDKWLTSLYIESGGGANYGESYHLAWYFAANRTSIDCHEKRGQKGFLFTIGDEPVLNEIPNASLQNVLGRGQYHTQSAMELLAEARKKYHVFHIHIKESSSRERIRNVEEGWRQIMGDNLIVLDDRKMVDKAITDKITSVYLSENGDPLSGDETSVSDVETEQNPGDDYVDNDIIL